MSGEGRVASLARMKGALETDLLRAALELRRASEEYADLASAFRASAARLREASGAISAAHHEREALVRVVASPGPASRRRGGTRTR